jgi:hypothetical protein
MGRDQQTSPPRHWTRGVPGRGRRYCDRRGLLAGAVAVVRRERILSIGSATERSRDRQGSDDSLAAKAMASRTEGSSRSDRPYGCHATWTLGPEGLEVHRRRADRGDSHDARS